MSRARDFKVADAIATLLSDSENDRRRQCLFEFMSYIFHPDNPRLQILDVDTLSIKYLYTESLQWRDGAAPAAPVWSNVTYIRSLARVLFDGKEYGVLGFDPYSYDGDQLLIADAVRFMLNISAKHNKQVAWC
jgi:hypothetical protein